MIIYLAETDGLQAEDAMREARKKLSVYRRERLDQLKLDADRARSAAAGLLLNYAVRNWQTAETGMVQRVSLTQLLQTADAAKEPPVSISEEGKPVFAGQGQPWFSLAHTGNVVVCAMAETPVGIDAEGNRAYSMRTVRRFFTEEELAWIEAAPEPTEQSRRFFCIWTGKEAYAKLQGSSVYKVGRQVSFVTEGAWDPTLQGRLHAFEDLQKGYQITSLQQ